MKIQITTETFRGLSWNTGYRKNRISKKEVNIVRGEGRLSHIYCPGTQDTEKMNK